MIKKLTTPTLLLCALPAFTGHAYATQPPDVVKSDGSANTAMGTDVLLELTTGEYNTGAGYAALYLNTTGSFNTALGGAALFYNSGSYNTASGAYALESNGGNGNTAAGYAALQSTTSGSYNTAVGYGALQFNTTSAYNTAIGTDALYQATGADNIAFGDGAGSQIGSGSNNIDIGNAGVSSDTGVIRIGVNSSKSQTAAYIAGISSSVVTGAAVYVTSSGQLGVLASSERYKTAIKPIGDDSTRLGQLRPVSFHLKADPKSGVQYGLIAEQVAKVYPELVIRDSSGQIQGVRYDELAPMLLNEVQKLSRQVQEQRQQLEKMERMNRAVLAAADQLLARNQRVAMR
jgi:hypothetical protein